MPVKVVKRGARWRIVERTGKIAKTAKGNARDGGGFRLKWRSKRQMRAINSK